MVNSYICKQLEEKMVEIGNLTTAIKLGIIKTNTIERVEEDKSLRF